MNYRDVMKLAFQYQETEYLPITVRLTPEQREALTQFYGDDSWQERFVDYIGTMTGVDNFLSLAPMETFENDVVRDNLGCTWQMGSTHHLMDWPLKEPRLGDYRLPAITPYYEQYVKPLWPEQIAQTEGKFRVIWHSFGLFERAWSLRGPEGFMMDLALEEKFAEELLEHITEWKLESIDHLVGAPVDGVFLTDDYAGQRGLLMGAERWRRLFKPRYKRMLERIHHHGLYTIMHMCGNISEVVPDLIEVGLDCMQSCQPECMDIYELKRQYGRDIRFWGGFGAQSVWPFGTVDDVRQETRKLKKEMGRGGGYLLAGSKAPGIEVPIENIAAFFEEATAPRT